MTIELSGPKAVQVLDQRRPSHSSSRNIPVPVTHTDGSLSHGQLLVRFAEDHLNVAVIDASGGVPTFRCPANKSCLQTVVF